MDRLLSILIKIIFLLSGISKPLAKLGIGCKVKKLTIENGKVTQVHGRIGINCQKRLFVDPVLCVAGPLEGIGQDRQILMPFISQQNGYILSPYMDYLSFFFNRKWRLPMKDISAF